jgi:hypothetical protein
MAKFSTNYHFPIFYPDWGFANILYFQRLRGNIFFDHAHLSSRRAGETRDIASMGTELYVDTKWWNAYPLTFGLRVSHLLNNGLFAGETAGSNWLEFVIPIVIPQ